MVGRPFVIPACISYYQTGGFPKPPFAALDFSTSSLVFGGFPKSLLIQCILPHKICLLPDVGGFPGALLVSAHTLPTSHIQLISLLLVVRGFPGYLPVSVYTPSASSETTYFPPCCQGIPWIPPRFCLHPECIFRDNLFSSLLSGDSLDTSPFLSTPQVHLQRQLIFLPVVRGSLIFLVNALVGGDSLDTLAYLIFLSLLSSVSCPTSLRTSLHSSSLLLSSAFFSRLQLPGKYR